MSLIGAIEAGGTKFILAVSDEDFNILDRKVLNTTDGPSTLAQVTAYFDGFPDVAAIGVAAFGPIDLNPQSPTYGFVLDTPKPGWANFDFLGYLKNWRDIPYYWTTDVNGSAWAEYRHGANSEVASLLYLTVGTGVGAGIIVNGQLLSGFGHPEAGHMMVQKNPRDRYEGHCPFHHDRCLEGVASGPAMEDRWGMSAKELKDDHEAWMIEADYLAQAAMTYTTILRPDRIVFGGGVSHRDVLLPLVRQRFAELMNGYLATPVLDDYLVPVANGDDAGILGCFYLAKSAMTRA
ncbi:ROK family protein [Fructobacillus sp. M1-13]|uniref:fructokinase n=1 Tax=Fructobacillus papyriferae TaxID=2713171 RepID=A0ABS5QPV5_9LACO|nr:ROK family protein [Fructobacillus papyriferae]MBS9335209.1 ROK family protein [Fructobacillus papyriferae]MCD2159122.1 ROK family protein [Fructobacillus papyriferae]